MFELIVFAFVGAVVLVALGHPALKPSEPQYAASSNDRPWGHAVVAASTTKEVNVTSSEPLLYEIRQLTKTYHAGSHTVDALRGLDLSLGRESTAITGPNGSGKSTLLHILGALDKPTSGTVFYNGSEMLFGNPRAMNEFRDQFPAFVLQDLNLFHDQSAVENVAFSLERYGESHRTAMDLAYEQLAASGIDTRAARRLPRQLSGGQRQRAAIARALLACKFGGAEVILADEPTAAVDSTDAERVFQSLLDLATEERIPVIVVTHNPDLAKRADRVLICKHGTVTEA